MKRRSFIKAAGSATAVAGAGVFSILKYPRGAKAAGWGTWPDDKAAALLPAELQAKSILELHVNGGMSMFDTFYSVPEWGGQGTENRFLWVFDQSVAGVAPDSTLQGRWDQCGYNGDLTAPMGITDGGNANVQLGPWAWPFRARPDVLARMRIVVTRHNVVAHEGANPLSFTGLALGNPRLAGLGTPIQRYFSENADAPGGGGTRAAPYSYVLYPAGYKPFNAIAASAVGSHPGASRPLVVSVEPNSELSNLLARAAIDNPAALDQAVEFYRSTYEARLRAAGHSAAARSPARENYEFSVFAREHAPELTSILSEDQFAPITPPGDVCGTPQTAALNMPAMQARLAASLLTRAEDAARYVLWIDAGINPSTTGGHDVHNFSILSNSDNLPRTFEALLDNIVDPFAPQAGDENRINLDDTMVVINTEFGRTPERQGVTVGTNHHPEGYVQLFIGGPMQASGNLDGHAHSIYGHITEAEGAAEVFASPAQGRMMMLQAMGIYPFSGQSYNVAEAKAIDELEGATMIRDELLGIKA